MVRKISLMVMCMMSVVLLSSCETVKGLGQDIQNTGDNVWEAINKK